MMGQHNLEKRCFGYECDIRDKCAHYVRPINYAEHFFQPVEKGEDCHHFTDRYKQGDGND